MVPLAAPIRSRLTEDERLLRSALLARMTAAQDPVGFAAAGQALGWSAAKTAAVGAAIAAKKLVVLDDAGCARFAYPVSAAPTAHQVTLADGRTLYAMCAIDALGCCFEFGQPIRIESSCQACGAPIHIALRAVGAVEAAPPTAIAVHVDLAKYEDWATKTWTVMNFFCTKNHYAAWAAAGPNPDQYGLPIEEAVAVSRNLFGS